MNTTLKIISAAILALSLSACSSKKKATDGAEAPTTTDVSQPPQLESTPMSFDASSAAGGSDSGKIAGLRTVNFAYDRASLTAEAKQKIQGNVDWLKANPKTNMQIEGHCDSRGSIEYNLSLGERRAQAVRSYMTSLGVGGNRLSIISYGKEKPLANGDSESDHSRNRRANFVPIVQ